MYRKWQYNAPRCTPISILHVYFHEPTKNLHACRRLSGHKGGSILTMMLLQQIWGK